MLIKRPSDIRGSEITDQKLYLNRREFLQTATGAAAAGAAVLAGAGVVLEAAGQPAPHGRKLDNVRKSPLSVSAADDKVLPPIPVEIAPGHSGTELAQALGQQTLTGKVVKRLVNMAMGE